MQGNGKIRTCMHGIDNYLYWVTNNDFFKNIVNVQKVIVSQIANLKVEYGLFV